MLAIYIFLFKIQARVLTCLEKKDNKHLEACQSRQEYKVNVKLLDTWMENVEIILKQPIQYIEKKEQHLVSILLYIMTEGKLNWCGHGYFSIILYFLYYCAVFIYYFNLMSRS